VHNVNATTNILIGSNLIAVTPNEWAQTNTSDCV